MVHDFRIIPEAARVDREWAVIDEIFTSLDTPHEPDPRLVELTPGQRAVYALQWIRAEVNNGGFDQCCFNSTASLLPEAIEGADLLEAVPWAALLREIAAMFSEPFPRDRNARQDQLDRLSDTARSRMGAIDGEMYALDGSPATTLDGFIGRYIEQHPAEFFLESTDEETAAETLVSAARQLIDDSFRQRLIEASALLREASDRSIAGGTGQAASLAQSLLSQIPLLGNNDPPAD